MKGARSRCQTDVSASQKANSTRQPRPSTGSRRSLSYAIQPDLQPGTRLVRCLPCPDVTTRNNAERGRGAGALLQLALVAATGCGLT